MNATPEPQIPTYRLTPVPITDTTTDASVWDVTVRPCRAWGRLTGTWDVWSRVSVLSTGGRWDPIPNETSPAWEREHEFPDATSAITAATRALPALRISGKTLADVLAPRLDRDRPRPGEPAVTGRGRYPDGDRPAAPLRSLAGEDLYGQRLIRLWGPRRRARWWLWVDPHDHTRGAVRFRAWNPRHLLAAWRHHRWARRAF